MTKTPDPLEVIMRPIVEGQLRSLLNDHPSILQGVDWFKPRDDKAQTFINSAGKRILRDLLCEGNRVRLVNALSGMALDGQDHGPPAMQAVGVFVFTSEDRDKEVDASTASLPAPRKERRVRRAAQALEADKLSRAAEVKKAEDAKRSAWIAKHAPRPRKGVW